MTTAPVDGCWVVLGRDYCNRIRGGKRDSVNCHGVTKVVVPIRVSLEWKAVGTSGVK
jgi:hypothetical protein